MPLFTPPCATGTRDKRIKQNSIAIYSKFAKLTTKHYAQKLSVIQEEVWSLKLIHTHTHVLKVKNLKYQDL